MPGSHACFVCNRAFSSEEEVEHHLQIAYRECFDDHSVLQQEPPSTEAVPVSYRAKLAAMQRFCHLVEELAGNDGIEGVGKTTVFKWKPQALSCAEQRTLEAQIPSIEIPCFDAPTMTVVDPKGPPMVYNPYTTSGACPSDFRPFHEESGGGSQSQRFGRKGRAKSTMNRVDSPPGDFNYVEGLESSGEDDGDYFQTTSAPLDLHSRDRPPLFLRVNDNLWVLQNVLPPSEGSDHSSFGRYFCYVRCVDPDKRDCRGSYKCSCDVARNNNCISSGRVHKESDCTHEETVFSSVNGHLGPNGGAIEVKQCHYGKHLIPLHEYEDERWLGSCKVDTHREWCVKCLGLHFGKDAKCIQRVREDWNSVNPDKRAGFESVSNRQNFNSNDHRFSTVFWPQRDHNDPIVKILAVDLTLRSSAGVVRHEDGSLQLRPVLPDSEADDDSQAVWRYEVAGSVKIFGEKRGYENVTVYRATRADLGSDGGEQSADFSFQNAGLFQASGRKDRVYYDAKIFYDMYYLKGVSDLSIESMWNHLQHLYRCTDSPISVEDKNHFYKTYHEFVRSLEVNRHEIMPRFDSCAICGPGRRLKMVIIDGTHIWIQQKMLPENFKPVTCCGDDEDIDAANESIPPGSILDRLLQTDIPDVSTRDRDYYTTSDNRRPVSKDQASALLKMARSYLKPVSSGGGGGGGGGGGEGGGGDGEEGGDGGEEEEGAAPFNDDDYTEMYNLESSAGHVLGKQLKAVCELFRKGSTVLSEALATVVKFASGRSSLIQTVPFKATVLLNKLLGDNCAATSLRSRYSAAIRSQLSGLDGQPWLAILLDEICIKAAGDGRASRSDPVLHDCEVVLSFVRYLCDIVQLAYRPEARANLVALASDEMDGEAPDDDDEDEDEEGDANACSYDSTEFLRDGVHAPGLNKLRERGKFSKDAKADQERASREGGCDKSFEAKKNKTGGLFTYVCRHRILYAFHVIPRAEGRNDPFSFFRTRWKKAPRVIIYDFSCQLMEYCLNRDPEFFAFTRFFIDRYHQVNHTSCSRSHWMAGYEDFIGFNSQGAEQVNSRLSRALSKTEMYNFHNFIHSVRSTTRDHNSACIAAADRFLEAKRVAQLRNFSSEAHGMEL